MDKLSLQNPGFATYAIAATLMIFKAVRMSWLSVVRMSPLLLEAKLREADREGFYRALGFRTEALPREINRAQRWRYFPCNTKDCSE